MDPVVHPGQYLRLDITESIIMRREGGTGFPRNEQSASHLYVPYDRSGEWVLYLGPLEPVEYFGAATKEKVRDYYATQPLKGPEPGRQIRGLAGRFQSGQTTSFGNLTPEEGATIPREPEALLAWIRAEVPGTDDGVWGFIADQLKSGLVPAKWRAALYRAAALIPGATVSEQQAALDGCTGTAVGRTDQDGIRTDLIFDPESGLFIGQRVINEKGFGPIPAGTKTGWTSVKTSVVGTAPTPATLHGQGCGGHLRQGNSKQRELLEGQRTLLGMKQMGEADAVLWDRCVQGDADALGSRFDRHSDAVFRYCPSRTGSWHDAEELVSVTFWKRGGSARALRCSGSPPPPWRPGVATNAARNKARSIRRREQFLGRLPHSDVRYPADTKTAVRNLLVQETRREPTR